MKNLENENLKMKMKNLELIIAQPHIQNASLLSPPRFDLVI